MTSKKSIYINFKEYSSFENLIKFSRVKLVGDCKIPKDLYFTDITAENIEDYISSKAQVLNTNEFLIRPSSIPEHYSIDMNYEGNISKYLIQIHTKTEELTIDCVKPEDKIICFDFDNTLTYYHSGGIPSIEKNYFVNIEMVKTYLQNLKDKKYKMYIVTRGVKEMVIKYLEYNMMDKYFEDVYGAISIDEINMSYKFPNAETYWSYKKVSILKEIMKINKCSANEIYFYDDTKSNIIQAKLHGFKNSFIVEPLMKEINLVKNLNENLEI